MAEYITNRYNIRIKKCCASCAYCKADSDVLRMCDIGEGQVTPKHLSPKWEMREQFTNAGKGGGQIIKLPYIDFVVKKQEEENERLREMKKRGEKIDIKDIKTITQFRAEYEEKFGTRFITDF